MSLYKRGRSYYYNFWHQGERYAGNIGPVSKATANQVYHKIKSEVYEGKYTQPKPDLTLADFFDEFIAWYKHGHKPNSTRRYHISWASVGPALGKKLLTDLKPTDIERYRTSRRKVGRSEACINRELALIRHLFSVATQWEKFSGKNPVKSIRFGKEPNGRARFLSPDEEQKLLACCGPQLRPLVVVAINTGMRLQECLNLTWQDVDFSRQVLKVQAAYSKNHQPREIPMNQTLQKTLAELKATSPGGKGPVFKNAKGQPYQSPRSAWLRAVKIAGLQNFRFHDLRHHFASQLVMSGVDLATVKELLGHKSFEMTLRYSHLSNSHLHQAVKKLVPGLQQNLQQGAQPDLT